MVSDKAAEVIKAYFAGGNAVNISTTNTLKAILEAIVEVIDRA
ncbi:MAG: hypothetical protein RL272_750 [Candidatus Parcubacteria bacterium]|jgi:hypothetical protein